MRTRWRVALAMAPMMWILPAAFVERARMDGHEAFITSVKEALRECDTILPEHEPVVVAGDAMLARHKYRLGWAFGSILKPPFHDRRREVVALWPRTIHLPKPPSHLVTTGLPAWVEVTEAGGRLVTADAASLARRRDQVAPVGFSGVLTLELLKDLGSRQHAGYPVNSDYSGEVILCSTVGAVMVTAPAHEGVVSLEAILAPVADQFWLPLDVDKDCPIFLVFVHDDGVSIGRMSGAGGFARAYVEWSRGG
jgi:hypothetical protein